MLKKDNIVRITFLDTEATLVQKQHLYVILLLSYKKLSGSKHSEIFRFSPNSEKMVTFQQGGLLDVVTE